MNGQALGDYNGYLYYTVWTLSTAIITMMVSYVIPSGQKCLLVGAVMLMVAPLHR